MDTVSLLVGLALGLVGGGTAGWLLAKTGGGNTSAATQAAAARARAEEIGKRVSQLEQELAQRERELNEARQHASELAERVVRTTAERDGERRSTAERVRLLEQAEQTLR